MHSRRTVSAVESVPASAHERGSGLASVLPDRWRWWEDGAHDGVTNMATDQALLAAVRPGVGVWRWYGWSAPTVSFGRNERVVGRYAPDWLTQRGLAAVRRPTGGRALLHARELTYSVTIPLPAAIPWRRAYDAINALLLDTLRALRIPAERSPGHGPVAPDGPVCFDQPAAGELTVAGRKLVGSAVWRQQDAYLQHGSILLHDDQQPLAPGPESAAAPPPAASLAAILTGRSDEDLGRATRAETARALRRIGAVEPFVLSPDWADLLASHQRHFAAPSWLWRR